MPHEVGSIIEGKVTGITKFGAFIELDDGAVGMVHISEISHAYVSDISEYLKEGQVVKVKVLSVGDNGKISLSIKRALPQEGSASFKRERGERAGSASAGGRPQQAAGKIISVPEMVITPIDAFMIKKVHSRLAGRHLLKICWQSSCLQVMKNFRI